MPTLTYTFNLPEEQPDAERYAKSEQLHSAAWEYMNYLRGLDKYQDEKVEKMSARELLDGIIAQFYEEFENLLD